MGARQLAVADAKGVERAVQPTWQRAKVTRQLLSNSEIRDNGSTATFDKHKAVVRAEQGGDEITRFQRVDGVFLTKVKLRNPLFKRPEAPGEAGFQRQGR